MYRKITRFAFGWNIGALGASGSSFPEAPGAVSAAIISCNIPGRSMEALARDLMAVRREVPIFEVSIACNSPFTR
jgi:hypothetical protein